MKTLGITCIDAYTYTPTIKALRKTLETLDGIFDIKTVYWFSDIDFPESIEYNVNWVKVNRFKKYTDEYNYITLKLLPHVAKEDYNLIIHADGFAVNRNAWDPQFLDYDYIGARWPSGVVGNGGFCLRSKKLLDALLELDVGYKTSDFPEDVINDYENYVFDAFGDKVIPEDNTICKIYRPTLEQNYGIKFPYGDIIDKFAIEHNMSSPWLGKSLGFHGKHGVASHYGIEL
jgi:hypothetical protein